MTSYADFIQTKLRMHTDCGFDAEASPQLYPFQREIVEWSLKRGRAAMFADCGLGKTPMQLDWAKQIAERTGGDVLILAPLTVSAQTQREGEKFHVPVTIARTAGDIRPGVNVANDRGELGEDVKQVGADHGASFWVRASVRLTCK